MAKESRQHEQYPGLNPDLEIRDSQIEGKGIFSKVHFGIGDEVVILTDPVEDHSVIMDDAEFEAFRDKCLKEGKNWDAVALPGGKHRVGTAPRDKDPSNYGNHSCDPNTKTVDDKVVAIKVIEPGDEITADYCQFSEVGWEMTCNCGSANCTGVVEGKVA